MSRRGSERSDSSRRGSSSRRDFTKAELDNRSRQLNPQDRVYSLTRGITNQESLNKDWKTLMDEVAASRIQSHADRTDLNQDFKSRAQSAAAKNKKDSE